MKALILIFALMQATISFAVMKSSPKIKKIPAPKSACDSLFWSKELPLLKADGKTPLSYFLGSNAQVSLDSKYLLMPSFDETQAINVIDIQTGKSRLLFKSRNYHTFVDVPAGSPYGVLMERKSDQVVYHAVDLNTLEVSSLKAFDGQKVSFATYDPYLKLFVGVGEGKEGALDHVFTTKLDGSGTAEMKLPFEVEEFRYNAEFRVGIVQKNQQWHLVDMATGSSKLLAKNSLSSSFDGPRGVLAFVVKGGTAKKKALRIQSFNMKGQLFKDHVLPPETTIENVFGQYAILSTLTDSNSRTWIMDLNTGRPAFGTVPKQMDSSGYADVQQFAGTDLVVVDGGEKQFVVNVKTGKSVEVTYAFPSTHGNGRSGVAKFDPKRNAILMHESSSTEKGTLNYVSLWTENGRADTFEIPDGFMLESVLPNGEYRFMSNVFQGALERSVTHLLVPNSRGAKSVLPKDWGVWTKNFSKVGHTGIEFNDASVSEFFKQGLHKKYPEEAAGILYNVLEEAPVFFNRLLASNPDTLKVIQGSDAYLASLGKSELKTLLKTVSQDIEKSFLTGNSLTMIDRVKLHAAVVKKLSPAQKEDFLDRFAETMKNIAVENDFSGVFQSKIYKMIRRAHASYFDIKEGPVTDFTFVQAAAGGGMADGGDKAIQTMILSSHEFKGSELNEYGFYLQMFPEIAISKRIKPGQILSKEKTVAWEMAGHKYSAKYSFSVADLTPEQLVVLEDAPNYAAMKADGLWHGMVMVGSNLGSEGNDVLAEYLQFYMDKGFRFKKTPEPVNDMKKYLLENTSNGKINYFVKEAHSDGDEKNLFRLAKNANIMVGEKKLADGRIHRIELVYPDGPEDYLLGNTEFGEAMKLRRDGQPFYYFNTSCWAATGKIPHEIMAAESKNFIPIGATTSVNTFIDDITSTEHQMLNAFLDEKSYDEMQKAMQKSPEYKAGTDDQFVFPEKTHEDGEEKYLDVVMKDVAIPIRSNISITRDGKPFNIDEAH